MPMRARTPEQRFRSRIKNLQSIDWKKQVIIIEQSGSRKPE